MLEALITLLLILAVMGVLGVGGTWSCHRSYSHMEEVLI